LLIVGGGWYLVHSLRGGVGGSDADAHWNRGELLQQEGKSGEAAVEYRAALPEFPANPWLHQKLAYVLQDAGDLDGAVTELQEAIRLEREDPEIGDNDAELHFDLARVLEKRGDRTEAAAQYRIAQELAPDVYAYHADYQRSLAPLKDDRPPLSSSER
jgi:tetratricopeptide (TPR) repeat protein